MDGTPDVGDHLLAEHRHEIEAQGGGEREHDHHDEEIVELKAEVATASDEALVDDPPEAVRNGEGRGRRQQKGDGGAGDRRLVARRIAPDHHQIGDLAGRSVLDPRFHRHDLAAGRIALNGAAFRTL